MSEIVSGRHTIVPDDVSCFVRLELGSFCSIASGLKIISGQHPAVDEPRCVSNFPFFEHGWGDYPPSRHGGLVKVGNDVWIGQDVSILDGVTIADGATVAACSVVTRDVEPYALVAGNPAEFKRARFSAEVVRKLLHMAWWDWSDEEIKEIALPAMGRVRSFLRLGDFDS